MGYRHYFYLVENTTIEKARAMPSSLFEEHDDGLYITDLLNAVCVFSFGKLYWDLYSKTEPLFSCPVKTEYYDDHIPQVGSKELLEEAITIYRNNIVKAKEEQVAALESKDEEKLAEFLIQSKMRLRSALRTHSNPDIKLNKYNITDNYYYDEAIFNLLHMREIIDWNKYSLVFMGS